MSTVDSGPGKMLAEVAADGSATHAAGIEISLKYNHKSKHENNSLEVRKKMYIGPLWACELCHNRNNPTNVTICTICNATRPVNRFGLQIRGKYYACVHKNKYFITSVSVTEVSTQHFNSFTLNIQNTDDSVEDSIVQALTEYCLEQEQLANSTIQLLAPSSEDVSSSLLSPALAYSPKKGHKKGKNKSHSTTSTPTHSTPKHESSHAVGSFHGLFDAGMSLFDTVVHNASLVAYDSKIGQYISVDTLNHVAEEGSPKLDRSIKKSLDYMESMKNERVVMSHVVKEVVKRRSDETYLYDVHADLDINRNEWDKRMECAMCERSYPKSQMPGQISFKAIVDWRASRDVPFPDSDHRLTHGRLHNATKLCSFCTQFFDTNAGNLVDKQAIKDSVGVGDIGLNGPLNCSNTVYKKMFRKAVSVQRDLEDDPLLKMQTRVALDVLRFKAQNKNKNARFLFNPKVANQMVDQDKVGSFLRKKYMKHIPALSSSSSVRSNKVILQPVHSNPRAGELDEDKRSADPLLRGISNTSSSTDPREECRDSNGVVMKNKGVHKRAESSDLPVVRMHARPFGANAVQKNTPSAAPTHVDILDKVLLDSSAEVITRSTRRRKKKPKKGSVLGSSCDSEGHNLRSSTGDAPPPARERKPLILKVSSSTLAGAAGQSQSQVLEIELPVSRPEGSEGRGGIARSLSVGPASMRSEFSLPLRGLLQNMKLQRRDTDSTVIGHADPVLFNAEPSASVSAVDLESNTSNQNSVAAKSRPTKSVLIGKNKQHSDNNVNNSVSLPILQPALESHAPSQPEAVQKSAKHKKLKPLQRAYAKPHTNASAPSQDAAWKKNIKKPVLVGVSLSPQAKNNSKNGVHVPQKNSFVASDDEYSDDSAEISDCESGAGRKKYPVTPPLPSRVDSYESDYSYNDPFELDEVEEEERVSPSATEWDKLGSMDQYNWANAGPFISSIGEIDTADGSGPSFVDNGFSPVNLEPSMLGSAVDRIRMLSRGSAGGLMSPASRGASASQFSDRRTPKIGMVSLNNTVTAAAGSSIEEDRYNMRMRSRGSRRSAGPPTGSSSTGIRFPGDPGDRKKTPQPVLAATHSLVVLKPRAKSEIHQTNSAKESAAAEAADPDGEKPRRRRSRY